MPVKILRMWGYLELCDNEQTQLVQAASWTIRRQGFATSCLKKTFDNWKRAGERRRQSRLAPAKRLFDGKIVTTELQVGRKKFMEVRRLLVPRGLALEVKGWLCKAVPEVV